MRYFLFLLLAVLSTVASANNYSSFLDVTIGQQFDHPDALSGKDTNRPATQFRVPNYGPTQKYFQEFSLTYLNSTNAVSIVTAEMVQQSLQACEKNKTDVAKLAKAKFPSHQPTSGAASQLGGSGEFSSAVDNTYYVIKCYRSGGPFWILQFQLRGIEQDVQLKKAWGEFFGN